MLFFANKQKDNMLGSFFDGGLGQLVAPDSKAPDTDDELRRNRSIFEFIAPDPEYYEKQYKNDGRKVNDDADIIPASTESSVSGQSVEPSGEKQIARKKSLMEIIAPDPSYYEKQYESKQDDGSGNASDAHPTTAEFSSPLQSYSTPLKKGPSQSGGRFQPKSLDEQVLSAAKGTAQAMRSSTDVWEKQKKFFQLCSSLKPLSEKQQKKLVSMLEKNPTFANSYSTNMAPSIPDGFTPIHAAAKAGNMEAMKILIQSERDQRGYDNDSELLCIRLTDLQGRTPLHIASEQGHCEIINFLREAHKEGRDGFDPVGEQAPEDMCGRTPLAWACTSRQPKAIKNRTSIERTLFSPGDKSICPVTPSFDRSSRKLKPGKRILELEWGYSEAPGMRVEMEDALCHEYPVGLGKPECEDEVGVFGVFDGHGDGGLASRYVAEKYPEVLKQFCSDNNFVAGKEEQIITEAMLAIDTMLYNEKMDRKGGTTAVTAIVQSDKIIVANVGDSRALLVSRVKPSSEIITEDEASPSTDARKFTVKSLSNDHKPNLPGEEKRISNAGLEVVSEEFEDQVFHKVQLADGTKLAVSRAFGDFDFKENPDLPPQSQALVCTPECLTHERTEDDILLLLACDGVFDVMSNDEVGAFVHDLFVNNTAEASEKLPIIGDKLIEECLAKGSKDNISVLIVSLPPPEMKRSKLEFS